jgi:hypothetical protein
MANNNQFLTTREFGSKTGRSSSEVSKLIRQGKIKAEKKSGKWMIDPDQLQAKAVQEQNNDPQPTDGGIAAKTSQKKEAPIPSSRKTYTLSEFAEMTYLTEFGVGLWLKQGYLIGRQNQKGEWLIDADNLQTPNVKRLVREDKSS